MQSNTEAVFSSDDESPNAMVARAHALVPELRRRQAETENAGHVLPDAIQALLVCKTHALYSHDLACPTMSNT